MFLMVLKEIGTEVGFMWLINNMPTGIYKRSTEQIEKQREMAKVLGLTNKGEGHPNWNSCGFGGGTKI